MNTIGCVSFLNSRPLVYGLDGREDLKIIYDVPSRLMDLVLAGRCEMALMPIIDYQRADDLVLVPASCIGADGHVYTVGLFSRVPPQNIRTVCLDTDSHTSVILCRLILKQVYHCEPRFVDTPDGADARLLIGDKVVVMAPKDCPHTLDLAYEWKRWTGLPFVFAMWMSRTPAVSRVVTQALAHALDEGMKHVTEIVERDAIPRGWPAGVAVAYLAHLLKFRVSLAPGSPQRTAIEKFHRLAYEAGYIDRCREITAAPV